jgi:hypothetical protein
VSRKAPSRHSRFLVDALLSSETATAGSSFAERSRRSEKQEKDSAIHRERFAGNERDAGTSCCRYKRTAEGSSLERTMVAKPSLKRQMRTRLKRSLTAEVGVIRVLTEAPGAE